MSALAGRWAQISERIERARARAERAPGSVRLVAVSKGHGAKAIRALYDQGQRDFGESYTSEWIAKRDALPHDLRWHFIGPLQSRKARDLARGVALWHTLARDRVLEKMRAHLSAPIEALVQINISQEPQKAGLVPGEVIETIERWAADPALRLRGLMCIPAREDEGAYARMAAIFEAAKEAAEARGALAFDELSMGMSDDFERAIERGATLVRIGTAIFGPRAEP